MKDLLARSNAFIEHLDGLFSSLNTFSDAPSLRTSLSASAATLSLDHAAAIRLTFGCGHPISAIALIRLQHEALLRSTWLFFIATGEQIEKLAAPLSPASQQANKNIPGVAKTLDLLVTSSVPDELKRVLKSFHEAHGPALHSFVHGGIHPLHRSASGVPLNLAQDALKQSNILSFTAYRLLAQLMGSAELMRTVTDAVDLYADCLSLEPSQT